MQPCRPGGQIEQCRRCCQISQPCACTRIPLRSHPETVSAIAGGKKWPAWKNHPSNGVLLIRPAPIALYAHDPSGRNLPVIACENTPPKAEAIEMLIEKAVASILAGVKSSRRLENAPGGGLRRCATQSHIAANIESCPGQRGGGGRGLVNI